MVTYCLYKDYFRSISFMLIAMGDKLKGKKQNHWFGSA